MAKSDRIAAFIIGAAAGAALVKYFSMTREERNELCSHLKDRTNELLDNAEETAEKVEEYIDEITTEGEKDWVDKLYLLKKMLKNFYGSDKHYFL